MKLISIIGPTAIGKSRFAIDWAKSLQTEIISSDSRQFYKELEIGTAKPTEEELAEVPHHFINNLSILDTYSVGDFEKDAVSKLSELFQKHENLIMVGGSPLYEKAVLEGLDDFPEVEEHIREELKQELEEKGLSALQASLKQLDPESYQKIDVQNPHRVMRALEITKATGQKYSSFLAQKNTKRPFEIQRIGLSAPREIIYERINHRVDLMREAGLLEEARKLYSLKNLNALQTVGYRELFDYLEGKFEVDFAFSEIKKNTRRFAKRQLTWYRNDPSIKWVDWDKTEEFLRNV